MPANTSGWLKSAGLISIAGGPVAITLSTADAGCVSPSTADAGVLSTVRADMLTASSTADTSCRLSTVRADVLTTSSTADTVCRLSTGGSDRLARATSSTVDNCRTSTVGGNVLTTSSPADIGCRLSTVGGDGLASAASSTVDGCLLSTAGGDVLVIPIPSTVDAGCIPPSTVEAVFLLSTVGGVELIPPPTVDAGCLLRLRVGSVDVVLAVPGKGRTVAGGIGVSDDSCPVGEPSRWKSAARHQEGAVEDSAVPCTNNNICAHLQTHGMEAACTNDSTAAAMWSSRSAINSGVNLDGLICTRLDWAWHQCDCGKGIKNRENRSRRFSKLWSELVEERSCDVITEPLQRGGGHMRG